MANTLPTEKKIAAVSMLREGNSIRSIERMAAGLSLLSGRWRNLWKGWVNDARRTRNPDKGSLRNGRLPLLAFWHVQGA